MPIPNVYPVVFGDFNSRDLLDRPAADVPQADLFDAIQQALSVYEGIVQDVISILANTTQVAKERYEANILGGADSAMLQPRGEYGKVLATRIAQEQGAENAFEVGYPLQAFADRAMFTPEWLVRHTVQDVNNKTFDAMIRDANTVFRHVLDAAFQNENYPYTDDKVFGQNLGSYEVKRLLNLDASLPGVFTKDDGTQVLFSTLNHYKVSGSAVFTNSTFAMAHDALVDVGMDSDIVYLVPKSAEGTIRLLSDFVPFDPETELTDPRIIDPPPVEGTELPPPRAIVRSPRSIGRIRSADANSGEVIVIPWMFNGYMFAMDRAADKPVVIRESDLAQFRGFNLVEADGMTPAIGGDKLIVNKYWQRVFGAGVRNRANGVAIQITTNATYTPPTVFPGI